MINFKLRYYLSYAKPFILAFIVLFIFLGVNETKKLILYTILLGCVFDVFILKVHIQFIHDTKTLDSKIDKLFNKSYYFLYIITPYFYAGENRLKRIIKASKNGCKVSILVHKNALNDNRTVGELKRLQDADCTVYVHPHLHSKIYLNESRVITGSVNLVKGSFDNSLEMGVSATHPTHHKKMYDMIKNGYLDHDDIKIFNADDIKKGYCIKTKDEINYNVKYPIKYDVYISSDERSGMFCHNCGKPAKTTIKEPLCDDCNK